MDRSVCPHTVPKGDDVQNELKHSGSSKDAILSFILESVPLFFTASHIDTGVMSNVLELKTCRDILVHVAANQLDYCARDDFVVAPYPCKGDADRLLPSIP